MMTPKGHFEINWPLKKHPCLLNLWTWILKPRIVRSADRTTWESRGQTRPNSTVENWKRKKFVKWDHGARITDFSSHSGQTMTDREAEEVYFICTLPKKYLKLQTGWSALKFVYSEKATKFCDIFILLLKISLNFVAFSEYIL